MVNTWELNTIEFSLPVLNPVIAIWSLGGAGYEASFTFSETPTLQGGGPNSIYGGSALNVNVIIVSGIEVNGVILFDCIFSSISWTNTPENWYGFTVGYAPNVPTPPAFYLIGSGLLGLPGIARHKKAA